MTEIPNTVTRVVIVATNGLVAREHFAESFDIHVQDEGRTVKLVAKGDGGKARNDRTASLGRNLVEDWHGISQQSP
jgi:hypothetical protein